MLNFLLLLLALLLGGAAPERPAQTADIQFQIKNAGLTVNGRLSGLQATVQFDPAHLGQAHLQATVPVSTIDTGIALRDRHLQQPEYFDAARYPLLTLESKAIRQTGAGQYEGVFMLTIKGVTREVRLPFATADAHTFRGTLVLNRLDYGIGKKSLLLGNEVRVSIVVSV